MSLDKDNPEWIALCADGRVHVAQGGANEQQIRRWIEIWDADHWPSRLGDQLCCGPHTAQRKDRR